MQLPRETPGEVLPLAMCSACQGGSRGMPEPAGRPLPSPEFRKPRGSAATAVAWPGDKGLGSTRDPRAQQPPGGEEGGRRLPEPGRASAAAGARAPGCPGVLQAPGMEGQRKGQGERGHKNLFRESSLVAGVLGDRGKKKKKKWGYGS